jgi:hypothetical protein
MYIRNYRIRYGIYIINMTDTWSSLEPYLTPDELVLVSSLDPKYKSIAQVRAAAMDQQRMAMLMSQRPDQYQMDLPLVGAQTQGTTNAEGKQKAMGMGALNTTGQLTPYGEKMLMGRGLSAPNGGWAYEQGMGLTAPNFGSGYEGGFAFAALLPILGSVAGPLISGAIDLFKGLFSKKKKEGQGIWSPNYRGGSAGQIVDQWFAKHGSQLSQIENQLTGLNGKAAWSTIRDVVKSSVHEILPQIANVTPQVASHLTELVVKKVIPNSFQRMTDSRKNGSGIRKRGGFGVGTIVKPVAKWVLGKILKKSDTAKSIYRKIKDTGAFLDEAAEKEGIKYGSGFFDSLKKFLKKSVPIATKVGEKAVAPAIDAVMGKFGISPFMGQVAGDLSRGVLQGVGDAFTEDKATNQVENPYYRQQMMQDYNPYQQPMPYQRPPMPPQQQQGLMYVDPYQVSQQMIASEPKAPVVIPKTLQDLQQQTGVKPTSFAGFGAMTPAQMTEILSNYGQNIMTEAKKRGRGPAKKKTAKKCGGSKVSKDAPTFRIKML